MLTEHQIDLLRDVFVKRKSYSLVMDGWCPEWQWELVGEAVKEDYLWFDKRWSDATSDDQYTAECYRPTEKLKELLGIKEKS